MAATITGNYSNTIATAISTERFPISAQWLARLNEILEVEANHVFPSEKLLDHIPALIAEIAAYLRAPQSEEISANTLVIEKARELGSLRHGQKASVHQLLREYEILGEILEAFVASETERLGLEPTSAECFGVIRRLAHATRTLMRTTVDTFVAEYTSALRERNERIDRFNRMMSHELRTPIGTLTFAATLLNTDLVQQEPARLEQVASVVKNNVERLSWLITNVQRLAGLGGELVDLPNHQRVEVTTLANEVSRQLEEMAAARGVSIHVQPALPTILTDPARVELILLNLISNGIKYSDPGKRARYIEVSGERTTSPEGTWTMVVRDNGLGIPHDVQPAIFDRFFRAHEHLDKTLGISGSGLGLSIVVDCVDAIGAAIGFDSEPGHGTTFRITFRNVAAAS